LFSIVSLVVLGCAFLLIILSWISGSKATRLLYGGSAERLNRKTRKQMVWAAYVTLPGAIVIVATLSIFQSMGLLFWEERMLLHLPLTVIPLLSIWFLSMPRLWKLWRETLKTTGAPLPAEIRKQAAHPLIIVPFQMSALGAATLFYFLLVPPIPLHLSSAIVPILIWIAATVAVWYVHDQRWQKVSHPDNIVIHQPWRRRLRALGIF
jgi:hypothetical protein